MSKLKYSLLKKTGEYYKLNVELTAGYQVGRNRRECH